MVITSTLVLAGGYVNNEVRALNKKYEADLLTYQANNPGFECDADILDTTLTVTSDDIIVDCYCRQYLTSLGSFSEMTDFYRNNEDCRSFLETKIQELLLTVFGSIIIVISNAGIQIIIFASTPFLRLPDRTTELTIKTIFNFVAQFINTGLIILILEAMFKTTDNEFGISTIISKII